MLISSKLWAIVETVVKRLLVDSLDKISGTLSLRFLVTKSSTGFCQAFNYFTNFWLC